MNKERVKWLRLDILAVVLLLGFDQLTKSLAVAHLKEKPAFVLISGVLELDYLENRGAAFGILQGQRWLLMLVAFVLVLLIGFFLLKMPTRKRFLPLRIAAVMIVAGGVGNMIDRFFFGYVVDFISFVLINYPIFNVADCYVVIAAILLVVLFLFVYKDEELEFLNDIFKRKKR